MAAVLVLALLGGAIVLWQQPWRSSDDATVAIPQDAPARLTAQLRELSSARSETDFVESSGDLPAARAFARRTWRSLDAVAVPGTEFRYISGGDVADRPDGSALAVVEVTWQAAESSGLAVGTARSSSVALRVMPQDDGGLSIIGAVRRAGSVPIWLVGAVTVDRADGATVIAIDGGAGAQPVDDLALEARDGVGAVLPGQDGGLTVVSPRTQEQMALVVGQEARTVARIAAVTTPLDGRDVDDAVVILNPRVFAEMDRRAARVVLTHEATHVLTRAVGTRAETWVIEGFADFVALRDDTAPLSVSAGQVLAEVSAGRTPRRLPTAADFDETAYGLGSVYESAWMIFRLLGERHGDDAVIEFYRTMVDGGSLSTALRESFGTSEPELTADWRAYLTKSASTMS